MEKKKVLQIIGLVVGVLLIVFLISLLTKERPDENFDDNSYAKETEYSEISSSTNKPEEDIKSTESGLYKDRALTWYGLDKLVFTDEKEGFQDAVKAYLDEYEYPENQITVYVLSEIEYLTNRYYYFEIQLDDDYKTVLNCVYDKEDDEYDMDVHMGQIDTTGRGGYSDYQAVGPEITEGI